MKDSVILSWIFVKKLFLPPLIAAISLFSPVKAQQYFFSDDFESYTAGEMLACQNPVDWTTWNLSPCDTITDAYVSDAYHYPYFGSNSLKIVDNNDEVHYWGPGASGNWLIYFYNYIPSDKTGYFNTLAQFINAQYWGMEVYFNEGGTGKLNANGIIEVASFTFLTDQWVYNKIRIDLDSNKAWYYYNGNLIYGPWPWTNGCGWGEIPLAIAANDFYGAGINNEMYIDNYLVIQGYEIPVELISFSAAAEKPGGVALNWQTATETNNRGFDVERSAKVADKFGESLTGKWERIGFVEGNGTTTLSHSYSYIDQNVSPGKYSYRLKQIDFDGSFNYSNEVEIMITSLIEFSLEQNYPNPFNPNTKIKYSIPEETKVILTLYNLLGEEVKNLVNEEKLAGNYTVEFNASSFPSGVYFYRIKAGEFVSTKKMILLK